MAFVILKDRPYRLGKHRSEQERNLRKEGMQTMTDGQLSRCEHLEKKSGYRRSYFDKREIDSTGKD